MYRKILIALGGKKTDEALLAHVEKLAVETRAAVTLLRVITVADDGAGGLGLQFQLELGSNGWRRKGQAETVLPQLEGRLRDKGLSVKTALVISTQSEADAIVRYAGENDHDLIAMVSDSRPWYRRWIGGCPADGVLRKATVPTLFIGDGARKVPEPRTAPQGNTMMEVLGSASL